LYDSGRKAVAFCGKANAEGLQLQEARFRAPGNRTPLFKFRIIVYQQFIEKFLYEGCYEVSTKVIPKTYFCYY
jgi:hypothetical protein